MQIYLVGGAVRDALLGLPVKDRDWVVVGADPDALRQAGFVAVGKDFPVFLHPTSHEEFALARTERKTGPGYHGFAFHAAPDVTLQDDLERRDLSINALALPAQLHRVGDRFEVDVPLPVDQWAAAVIDPHGGMRDLQQRVLRHVGAAFREDPVRILRLARLAARFADFSVAPATQSVMREMVASGEVDHLVAERVWQELAKGLMERTPSRMFTVLHNCGALQRLLPELAALDGVAQRADYHPEIDTLVHVLLVLDMCAQLQAPLTVRLACLLHDLGKGNTPADVLPRHIGHEQRSATLVQRICARLRIPNDCRELADVVAREHSNVHRSSSLGAAALVRLLERCDAFRKPERFDELLLACECDARGRLGLHDQPYPARPRLQAALAAAQQVATADIAALAGASGLKGPQIGERIHQARAAAVHAALHGPSPESSHP